MMCNSQNTIIVVMLNVFCLYVCGSEICLKLKLEKEPGSRQDHDQFRKLNQDRDNEKEYLNYVAETGWRLKTACFGVLTVEGITFGFSSNLVLLLH